MDGVIGRILEGFRAERFVENGGQAFQPDMLERVVDRLERLVLRCFVLTAEEKDVVI